ncbi:hypothetical protein KFK14_16845 [Sphingobium phenoxybenzoativorans]|uniref:Uncharacterized protein n=1 Tax=Sphingobium phenoxybenzoativorans TaxID=1592790 RepID=A0A975K4K1_9SPHN|nr:hypothetical protein [Sphingobium phenoxybenzoativorans]QUT04694.1 hypothetical protein KFK14_16845 [Sphingobium phenoxybenzoativorans]
MAYRSVNDSEGCNSPLPLNAQSRLHGNGVIIAIVAIALILAIGFFYVASERRDDARSNAAIGAAEAVDQAARNVGDATKKAAEKLQSGE